MKKTSLRIAGILLILLIPALGTSQEDGEDSKLEAVIEQLGDPSFQVRIEAMKELRESGIEIQDKLEEYRRHPNLEIRLRVAELISEIKRNDLQDRIRKLLTFQADGTELSLPGWEPYIELVGDSKASRNLFAEMVQLKYSVLQATQLEDQQAIYDQISLAAQSEEQNNQTVSPGVYAAYLLAGSLAEKSPNAVTNYIYVSSQRPPVRGRLESGDEKEPLRLLLNAFLPKLEPGASTISLQLATQFNLDVGIEISVELLESPQSLASYQVRYAIMCLAKLGDESHLPALQPFLSDETELNVYLKGKQTVVPLRDYALAACLFIVGESPIDYGFEFSGAGDTRESILPSVNLGFVDSETRDDAFKRWDELAKKRTEADSQTAETSEPDQLP